MATLPPLASSATLALDGGGGRLTTRPRWLGGGAIEPRPRQVRARQISPRERRHLEILPREIDPRERVVRVDDDVIVVDLDDVHGGLLAVRRLGDELVAHDDRLGRHDHRVRGQHGEIGQLAGFDGAEFMVAAEVGEQLLPQRHHLRRRSVDLQVVQRQVRGVEVHRHDPRRIGGEIGQRIAAARGDGDDAVTLLDAERRHIDIRIFPYLRIDQSLEQMSEKALADAGAVFVFWGGSELTKTIDLATTSPGYTVVGTQAGGEIGIVRR